MHSTSQPRRTWMPWLVFVIALITIGMNSYLQYQQQVQERERSVYAIIDSITDLKVSQLTRLIDELHQDIETIRLNSFLAQEVEQWLMQGAPASGQEQAIRERLVSLSQINGYQGVTLLDTKGLPRIEIGHTFITNDTGLSLRAMGMNEISRSDIHWSTEQMPEMGIVGPLVVGDLAEYRVVGAIYINIDTNRFFAPFLRSWPVPEHSGETLLVRQDGNDALYLSELHYLEGSALSLKLPLDQPSLVSALALRGQPGVFDGVDYRGIPVIAAARPIPGTSWILISKIDRNEIEAPLRDLAIMISINGFLLIGLMFTISVLWWRKQQVQHHTALAEAELERQALTQHYDYATKHARDIVLLVDAEARIREANDAAVAAYGYPREELLQMRVTDLRPPEFQDELQSRLEEVQGTGSGITYETVHRRRDGSSFPVESSVRKIDVEGKTFYYAINRDITRRKQTETALRENREMLNTILNSIPADISVKDINGRYDFINRTLTETIGRPANELLGKTAVDIFGTEIGERVESIDRQVITTGKATPYYEFPSSDNQKTFLVTKTPLKDATGNINRVATIAFDITERKQAEQELHESEQRFRGLFEQSIAGIGIIDYYRLSYVNPRMAEIFGYTVDELISQPVNKLIAEADQALVAENIRKRYAGEVKSMQYSFKGRRKDGTYITVGVHGAAATIDGRPVVIGMLQDISERERNRLQIEHYLQQLEQAMLDTVQAVSTIVELRDPYTAGHEKRVGALARAIGEELGLPEETCRGLEITGMVHDLGKVAIPAEILSKPGRLTEMEFAIVKTHAQCGYDILKDIDFPWPLAATILQHHERVDGSGYPFGLKGDQIILEARIIAVADTVEAMTTHRPYRPGLGIDRALVEIEEQRGTRYDAKVADACLRLFRDKGYQLPEL